MKRAFTLIELLVVLVIMTVVMGLIIPQGSKMLDSFKNSVSKIQQKHQLSLDRSSAFIKAEPKKVQILGITYNISTKGVLEKDEKSNADH